MTTRTLIFAALAALMIGSASGQSASPVELKYKFTPGETTRFRIYQHTTGNRSITGSSAPSSIDVELTSIIRVRCSRIMPSGEAEIAIETESSVLKIGGRTASNPPASEPRTMLIDSRGNVVQPEGAKASPQASRSSKLDFGSVESIALLAILPEKPVSTGDTWSAEIPLPISPGSKLTLSFRLEDVKRSSSGRVAVVKLALSTPINADVVAAPPSPQGSQEGTATLNFDLEKGSLQYAEGSVRSILTTYLRTPRTLGTADDAAEQYAVSKFNLESKFAVRRLDETEPVKSAKP